MAAVYSKVINVNSKPDITLFFPVAMVKPLKDKGGSVEVGVERCFVPFEADLSGDVELKTKPVFSVLLVQFHDHASLDKMEAFETKKLRQTQAVKIEKLNK